MLRPPLPELPLLRKELVGLLRTRRAFWLLAGTVLASSLLALLAWPAGASGVAESDLVAATAGTFLLAQLTAALMIVPAFAAGAISGEREQGTYELLLATRLSPQSIVISKALASAGYVVILLVASAPCVVVLHLLGGVTFRSILRCQAVTLAAVALSTLICLWASIRAERTSKAVTAAVAGVVFWNGGLGFLLLLGTSLLRSVGSTPIADAEPYAAVALSPHAAIAFEVFGMPDFFGAQATAPGHPWAVHLAAAGGLCGYYMLRLLLRAGPPGVAVSWRDLRGASAHPRRFRRRPFLAGLILESGRDGGPFGDPVFQKELRTEFFGRVWYRRLVFWGLCVLFGAVILAVEGYKEVEKEVTTIAGIGILLVSLLAPGVAASAYPREIEHGNLDHLLGTLLSPWEVLRGKFLAALYATFGVVAAAGWWIGITAWSGPWQVPGNPGNLPADHALLTTGLLPMGVLAATWVFVTAVATCASVLTKRTLPALVGSYVALAIWFLAIPVLSGGLGASLSDLRVATQPLSALGAALRGDRDIALLCFFLLHAAMTLAIWHVARLEVEVLRGRDG